MTLRLAFAAALALLPAAVHANCPTAELRICLFEGDAPAQPVGRPCAAVQCATADAVFDCFGLDGDDYIRIDATGDTSGKVQATLTGIGPGGSDLVFEDLTVERAGGTLYTAAPSVSLTVQPCNDVCAGEDADALKD